MRCLRCGEIVVITLNNGLCVDCNESDEDQSENDEDLDEVNAQWHKAFERRAKNPKLKYKPKKPPKEPLPDSFFPWRVFGAKVKEASRLKGWNRFDLAKELGVSNTWVYEIERGFRRPGPKLTRKIAFLLGGDEVKWLALTGRVEPPSEVE